LKYLKQLANNHFGLLHCNSCHIGHRVYRNYKHIYKCLFC